MLLNFGASNYRTGVAAREHALHYLGRRHAHAASLWARKRDTHGTCERRSPTGRAGTSQWRCRSKESGGITRELGLSCQYFLTISHTHTSSRQIHACFYTRVTACSGNDYSIPFALRPVTSIWNTERCLTFVIINSIGEQLCTYWNSKFHPRIFIFVTSTSYILD